MSTLCFGDVLAKELAELDARRKELFGSDPPAADGDSGSAESQALARNLAGMGVSGGGIRSATFNLGILQGLAEQGLLPQLDYLSTVSGGGYIGSWLHGVIQRMHKGRPDKAAEQLSPSDNPVPAPASKDPVSFLRKYSNYLAPRLSLFSPDVWVIGSIWLRNMFLNQCVLVPFLAALLLMPVLFGLVHQLVDAKWHDRLVWLNNEVAAILLVYAVISATARLRQITREALKRERSRFESRTIEKRAAGAGWCAFFVFAASILIGVTGTYPTEWPALGKILSVAALFVLFLLFQLGGGFAECFSRTHKRKSLIVLHLLWMPAACTAVTAGLICAVLSWSCSWNPACPGWPGVPADWYGLTWSPLLIILALSAGVSLLIGFMGGDYVDAAREWISRVGAVLCLLGFAWAAAAVFGVFAPLWVAMLFAAYGKTALTAAGGWLVTSGAGVFAGNSGKTSGAAGSSGVLEIVAKVAPTVFMVGYLALISMGLQWGIRRLAGDPPPVAPASAQVNVRIQTDATGGLVFAVDRPDATGARDPHLSAPLQGGQAMPADPQTKSGPAWTQAVIANHWRALNGVRQRPSFTLWIGVAFLALLGTSLVFASRVNINEFSMHHFYRNRLVRCYLGASRGRGRRPDPFTGFDAQDDIQLADLSARRGYYGPYAILNTALNTNRGSELAKQERKCGSFVYTPLYCGFTPERSAEDDRQVERTGVERCGYRDTTEFSYAGGPHVGTAMAISGAAANPNMGFHTSGSLAFLLTVFNVRLGWWVGNPRWDGPARRPGPLFALRYLLDELLAQTNDRSKYLNLSDGGHYDNLGLYELVRRRCRFILIGDAEQDPDLAFDSLAAAIRKCRTDFGVEIEIDIGDIKEKDHLSKSHCAVGRITYPETDPAANGRATGLLVYFKASLTGDEPEDVQQYRARFDKFPHQSTADQFFTESQFESYRQLGLHIARTAFEGLSKGASMRDACVGLANARGPKASGG